MQRRQRSEFHVPSELRFDKSINHTQNMSRRDIAVKIINLITQEGVSKVQLRKILDYVESVVSESD